MEEFLFSIACPTCERALAVRDEAAIGAILHCPNCASMVHVVPPPGWKSASDLPPAPSEQATPPKPTAEKEEPPAARPPEVAAQAAAPVPQPPPPSRAATAPPPIPCPPTVNEPASAGAPSNWLLWVVVPVLAMTIALGVLWKVRQGRSEATEESAESIASGDETDEPVSEGGSTEDPSHRLDRRWLPSGSRLVISIRLSSAVDSPQTKRATDVAEPIWESSVGRLLEGLGLNARSVRRLTWAACDLAASPDRSAVVIELEAGTAVDQLEQLGEEIDLQVGGKSCRRAAGSAWPHPFALVDERTIVTACEALLRQMIDRSDAGLESAALDRLLKAMAPDADVSLAADLAAVRAAGAKVPDHWLDVWPAGRDPFRVISELPQAVGFSLRGTDRPLTEVGLVCEGETAADKVRAAVEQLKSAADASLGAEISAGGNGQYALLLKHLRGAVQAGRCEVADDTVWFRTGWEDSLPRIASAVLDSPASVHDAWLAAGSAADDAHHRRLLATLLAYAKAEGHFPTGAGGGTMLPPATRLSWIAELLPYLDRSDWRRELQPGYSWNSPKNRPVTQRPLEPVINPVVPGRATEDGFPVTHYVGVAGVGEDAGDLKADHPRAGVFGFARNAKPQEIPDGAANTIAVLGVTERLGPWAAGGHATVRPITKRPLVNGPDGFGSGQPNGMLAGMADGSVRFLSKDIDPKVAEQLATINGGERPELDAVAPRYVVAQAKPARPAENGTASLPAKSETPPKPAAPKEAVEVVKPKPTPEKEGVPEKRVPMDEGDGNDDSPDRVDVESRLAERIPEIELPGLPLLDAVRFLGQVGRLQVTFDFNAMAVAGSGLSDEVKLKLADATLGQIFETVLASRGLGYAVEHEQLLVTLPEKRRTAARSEKYSVADLTGPEPAAMGELAGRIRRLIEPESWRDFGGQGNIVAEDNGLNVTQIDVVHLEIRGFLEKLRAAREQGSAGGGKLVLASRFDRARGKLRQPVTANFPEPAPLVQILGDMEGVSKTKIVVDWLTLTQAGVAADAKGSLKVHAQPLQDALVQLLQPLGLSYRIVSEDTFEVTTRKAAAARMELECYALGSLMENGRTAEEIIEQLKDQVTGASWSDAGGQGVLCFDKPSGHLIVRQSQPVQVKLQILLNKLTGELGVPAKPESKPFLPPAPKRR